MGKGKQNMTRIYFRTDGNSEIATGHLMRCLSIARVCAQKGGAVTFVVSDEESLSLLQERFAVPQEFTVRCLHTDYRKPASEIPRLLSCLEEHPDAVTPHPDQSGKPWLFLDSYYVTSAYFQALHDRFRVAYLDDLRSFDCPVDLLINYDTEEDCAFYADAACKLLGPQYTPLREQFRAVPYEVRPTAGHVLLSTGGTDPYGAAESLLGILFSESARTASVPGPAAFTASQAPAEDSFPDTRIPRAGALSLLRSLHYHVLTSGANTRYAALAALAQTRPNVHIHTGITDVAALMASCDLAVSAGGTTLCELCAVGVPSVSYLMADNQRTAVETFAKKRLIPCAGDIRALSQSGPAVSRDCLCRILAFLSDMAQDSAARAAVSASMKDYLDGSGAEKIAQTLLR